MSVTDHLEEPETLFFGCVAKKRISKWVMGTSRVTHIKIAAARMFMAYCIRSLSEKPRIISDDGT